MQIINGCDIGPYLSHMAGTNKKLEEIMLDTLVDPLKRYMQNLHEIEKEKSHWDTELKTKFARATEPWFEFFPDKKLDSKIRRICDWMANAIIDIENNEENSHYKLTPFTTIEEAKKLADQAFKRDQKEHAKRDEIAEGDIKTIMQLDNGFSIVQILTPRGLQYEAAFMQHCTRKSNYQKQITDPEWSYYSLRDSNKKPHVSFEIKTPQKTLEQCEGKQNKPAVTKYWPHIHAFIKAYKLNPEQEPREIGLIYQDGEYYNLLNLPEGFNLKTALSMFGVTEHSNLPEKINGSCDLRNSAQKNLGQLKRIGTWLDMTGTGITDISQLEEVGKSIHTDIGRFSTLKEAKTAFAKYYSTPAPKPAEPEF